MDTIRISTEGLNARVHKDYHDEITKEVKTKGYAVIQTGNKEVLAVYLEVY